MSQFAITMHFANHYTLCVYQYGETATQNALNVSSLDRQNLGKYSEDFNQVRCDNYPTTHHLLVMSQRSQIQKQLIILSIHQSLQERTWI